MEPKSIKLTKGDEALYFRTKSDAAEFLEVDPSRVTSAKMRKRTIFGWLPEEITFQEGLNKGFYEKNAAMEQPVTAETPHGLVKFSSLNEALRILNVGRRYIRLTNAIEKEETFGGWKWGKFKKGDETVELTDKIIKTFGESKKSDESTKKKRGKLLIRTTYDNEMCTNICPICNLVGVRWTHIRQCLGNRPYELIETELNIYDYGE